MLAVAVTIIEVALIVTLMIAGGPGVPRWPRHRVRGGHDHLQRHRRYRTADRWSALPPHDVQCGRDRRGAGHGDHVGHVELGAADLHARSPRARVHPAQLAFAAIASLALYTIFVITQTVRHRDFFLPMTSAGEVVEAEEHADPPSNRAALASLGLLLLALVSVVGLAKVETPAIKPAFCGRVSSIIRRRGDRAAGVVARDACCEPSRTSRRIQTSLNLAFGSAMASIGLTIPAIAVASIWLEGPLLLGLDATQMVLLAVTVVVAILTVVPGRATRLQGAVHLVLLAAFLFLAVNP